MSQYQYNHIPLKEVKEAGIARLIMLFKIKNVKQKMQVWMVPKQALIPNARNGRGLFMRTLKSLPWGLCYDNWQKKC